MKKVLLVGIIPYEILDKVHKKYFETTMFIDESWLHTEDNAKRIIETVKMVDAVIINGNYRRLLFEIAAVMLDKPIESLDDYPVDDGGEEA